jgi:hypothetical protein
MKTFIYIALISKSYILNAGKAFNYYLCTDLINVPV